MPIANSIIWTDEERKQVVDKYWERYPNIEPDDARVRIAAQILPPERQRLHISPNDPVKRMIYQKLGKPMPLKNQKRSKAGKKAYKRWTGKRNRENLLSAEGERAYKRHATNSQPSIATLQSSKPMIIRIVLDLALNAAATIVRE